MRDLIYKQTSVGLLALSMLSFGGCHREDTASQAVSTTEVTHPYDGLVTDSGIITKVQKDVSWKIPNRSDGNFSAQGTLVWIRSGDQQPERLVLLITSGMHIWTQRHSDALLMDNSPVDINASWTVSALIPNPDDQSQTVEVPALGMWKVGKVGEPIIF